MVTRSIRTVTYILVLTIIAVTVALILYQLTLLSTSIRRNLDTVSAATTTTLRSADAAIQRSIVMEDKVIAASDAQISAWNRINREIAKTVADVHDLTIHTDISLNREIAPRVAYNLEQVATLTQTATDSINSTTIRVDLALDDMKPAMDHIVAVTASAADSMPALRKSFDNVGTATDNAVAITAKVREGVDYEVNSLMKPVRKIKLIGEELVRIAGKLFGL